MKSRTIFSLFLLLCIAVPAGAQSNFAVDFVRDYHPNGEEAAPPVKPPTPLAQFLQTGEIPITMNDLVNLMLDQNLDVASNRLTPRSSLLQTLVFYKILQPSISFSGSVSRNTAFSTSQLNGASSLSQLQHNFSAGISKNLAAGTTVGVTATMARVSSNSVLNTFNPSYSGKITYSISQHLLQNRGRDITLRQVDQAGNSEKISEAQFEIQLSSLIQQAQKAYWDLVFSQGDLQVKKDSLDLANKTLDENLQKVEIGTLAQVDVLQTKLDVAQRNDTKIGAEGVLTQNQDQLKKLISNTNDPSMFMISLKTLDAPPQPNPSAIPTLAEAISIAIENRPEIRQALLDLRNKDIDVQYTKNQKMPILDLNGSYTQNGTGGTQTIRGNVLGSSSVQQVIPGGVFDAFGQLFGYNYTGYSMGFSLIIPLKNKAAESDFSRAVNERKLSESKIDTITQGIALEVRNALTAVQVAQSRVDTAKATLDLAAQTKTAEEDKFKYGTSIVRFVLEEQQNYVLAQTAELQAEINYTKALVDLDHAMGMTLRRNNVQLEKAMQLPINPKAD
jgi:outer membrane protein